jgi:hypothetical protein
MENQEDNGWGFYCDIELNDFISQPEEKKQQQQPRPELRLESSLRLESLRLEKQQQQHSCIREATQHVVAICVMATVILFM